MRNYTHVKLLLIELWFVSKISVKKNKKIYHLSLFTYSFSFIFFFIFLIFLPHLTFFYFTYHPSNYVF